MTTYSALCVFVFFFSSRRRHTRLQGDWSSDVCSSDLPHNPVSLNRDDAERLGIANGDTVRIRTPGGAVTAVAMVRDGVMPGTVAIEHEIGRASCRERV